MLIQPMGSNQQPLYLQDSKMVTRQQDGNKTARW
jgi:hypothetical protein